MSSRGRSTSPKPLQNSTSMDVDAPSNPSAKPDAKVIIITNLTRNVVESHLRTIFGFYGRIVKVDLPVFGKSGQNRGKAALEYEIPSMAHQAAEYMNGGQLDGAILKVELSDLPVRSRSRRARSFSSSRSRSPARYRGKGGDSFRDQDRERDRERDRDRDRDKYRTSRGGYASRRGARGGGGARGGFRRTDRSRSRSPIRRGLGPRRRSPSYSRGGYRRRSLTRSRSRSRSYSVRSSRSRSFSRSRSRTRSRSRSFSSRSYSSRSRSFRSRTRSLSRDDIRDSRSRSPVD